MEEHCFAFTACHEASNARTSLDLSGLLLRTHGARQAGGAGGLAQGAMETTQIVAFGASEHQRLSGAVRRGERRQHRDAATFDLAGRAGGRRSLSCAFRLGVVLRRSRLRPALAARIGGISIRALSNGWAYTGVVRKRRLNEKKMIINPLGNKTSINPQQASQVKRWVSESFALAEDIVVMVTELQCTEEGCPPLETVIAILDAPGQPRQFKLHKALAEVAASDIQNLIHSTNY